MLFDKVELIPLQPTHARLREMALSELAHDPFSKYISDNIKAVANNIRWLENASEKNLGISMLKYYGIFSPDREVFVGEIGIDEFDEVQGIANVFYWVRPELRNRGIAKQAIELLRVEAWHLNIRYLKFIIDKSNFLSERVIRKVGASREATPSLTDITDPYRYYYFLELQTEENKTAKVAF